MTIGDIAQKLDCTSATVRNYVKKFGPYLSPAARKKTGKRFTYQDLVTLRAIRGHLDDGVHMDDIASRLTLYAEIVDGQEETQEFEYVRLPDETAQTAITLPQVSDFVQQALDNAAQQHQREIDAKDETIALLRDELERARLPWWKRLF